MLLIFYFIPLTLTLSLRGEREIRTSPLMRIDLSHFLLLEVRINSFLVSSPLRGED
jgi:hypothetical protein